MNKHDDQSQPKTSTQGQQKTSKQKLTKTSERSQQKTSTQKLSKTFAKKKEPEQAQNSTEPTSESITMPDSTTMPQAVYEHEYKDKKAKALAQAGKEEGIHFSALAKSDESKKEFEVPLRTSIRITGQRSSIDATRTSVWNLLLLGQMTVNEMEDFVKTYGDDLTVNEKAAYNLIRGTLNGDREDRKTFWELQGKIAARPKTLAQVNFNMNGTPEGAESKSVMAQMLDQVTKNISESLSRDEDADTPEDIVEGEIASDT